MCWFGEVVTWSLELFDPPLLNLEKSGRSIVVDMQDAFSIVGTGKSYQQDPCFKLCRASVFLGPSPWVSKSIF